MLKKLLAVIGVAVAPVEFAVFVALVPQSLFVLALILLGTGESDTTVAQILLDLAMLIVVLFPSAPVILPL